jgi:hypothetical protein
MKRIFRGIVVGAAALTWAARAETPADVLKKPLPPAFDPAAIDQSVEPCVDFYQHACGAWLKASPIPPDQQIWWRISELDEHIRAALAAILEEAAAGHGANTQNRRKIGDYYASRLDESAIDAKGLKPFAPELARIAALEDKKELAELVAHLHRLGTKPLFSFSSTQDYTDASMMIAQADQDGFALPDRDYYLTHEFKDERAAYRAHLARMFGLLGRLLPGMTANVEIITGEHPGVVVVPNDALRFQPRGPAEALISDATATVSMPTASAAGDRTNRLLDRLKVDLELTPDVDKVRSGVEAEFAALRSAGPPGTGASQEDAREQARMRVAKVLRAVLTPDRYKKYEELQRAPPSSPRSAMVWTYEGGRLVPH